MESPASLMTDDRLDRAIAKLREAQETMFGHAWMLTDQAIKLLTDEREATDGQPDLR